MTDRKTDHEIDPLLEARWSPRAFSSRAVTEAEVMRLLEAARWAPSASNLQPWRFAWALKGDEAHAAMVAAMVPFNQSWAAEAPLLLALASVRERREEGEAKANPSADFDSGAAWMSLALQATSMGLFAHGMSGVDFAALAKSLDLPEGLALQALIAVGEQGPVENLPERMQKGEVIRPRHPVASIAGRGSFPA